MQTIPVISLYLAEQYFLTPTKSFNSFTTTNLFLRFFMVHCAMFLYSPQKILACLLQQICSSISSEVVVQCFFVPTKFFSLYTATDQLMHILLNSLYRVFLLQRIFFKMCSKNRYIREFSQLIVWCFALSENIRDITYFYA